MDQQSEELTGIIPVLPTPFLKNGKIDCDSMKNIVEFAIDCGVSGVVYPGFASEVGNLTIDERKKMLALVVNCVGKSIPVIAGGSSDNYKEVVEHGRFALELGLKYLMVQPPSSLGSNSNQVHEFILSVLLEIPDIQLVLQNAPEPRGPGLSAETICRLCENVPLIRYVKEESLPAGPSISFLTKYGPDTLKGVIGGGGARYILDEYKRGACAAMPAVELADIHVELDKAWRTGKKEAARKIYIDTLPLLSLQALYRTRLTKMVLTRREIMNSTAVRMNLPTLDSFAVEDIDNNLWELGLVD